MKKPIVVPKKINSKGILQYLIQCENCKHIGKVYHMHWCSIECQSCHKMIQNPKHNCAGKSECYYEDSD